jgi:hypothetical protein
VASDIFISYSSDDRRQAEELALFLEESGYSAWWDRQLIGGDEFREKIGTALNEARAAIVIWTQSSIASRWVLDESDTAASAHKLIPVRSDNLTPQQIPFGFRGLHTVAWSDRKSLLLAIAALIGAAAVKPTMLDIWRSRLRRQARIFAHILTIRNLALAAVVLCALAYLSFDFADWRRIRDSMEPLDYQHHLQSYPLSLFRSEATKKLAGLAEWEAVKSSRNTVDLQGFVAQFPDSTYGEFARLRLRRLQAISTGEYRRTFADASIRTLETNDLEKLNCDQLWFARNDIYYALGYCFRTDAARGTFKIGKECPYDSCPKLLKFNSIVSEQVMSTIERDNITRLDTTEKQRGCRVSPPPQLCSVNP